MNWKLATGHDIAVDNEGAQTVVTIHVQSAGQQQRTSNSFTTGIWLEPPQLLLTATGACLKIVSASGESLIQIQGNHMQMQSGNGDSYFTTTTISNSNDADTSTSGFEPMQLMQPMQPMQPMQMGNMQMSMQPMVMRMGNMELNMDAATQKQGFCTECGAAVKPTDKFCASCGTKLR